MIEPMNKTALAAMIELHSRELKAYERIRDRDVNCDRCTWRGRDDLCKKWNAPVPPEVRKTGCDEWDWDSIPF